jgi:hypothetical protein
MPSGRAGRATGGRSQADDRLGHPAPEVAYGPRHGKAGRVIKRAPIRQYGFRPGTIAQVPLAVIERAPNISGVSLNDAPPLGDEVVVAGIRVTFGFSISGFLNSPPIANGPSVVVAESAAHLGTRLHATGLGCGRREHDPLARCLKVAVRFPAAGIELGGPPR